MIELCRLILKAKLAFLDEVATWPPNQQCIGDNQDQSIQFVIRGKDHEGAMHFVVKFNDEMDTTGENEIQVMGLFQLEAALVSYASKGVFDGPHARAITDFVEALPQHKLARVREHLASK
jgi:hypothetical protein